MTNSKSKISINCLRALSLDQIANANSGHPGIALGAAPIFYTLFKYHLNVCPKVPNFFNRDRFIISAGHASSLVYATMVCAGYKNLTTNDLKDFRKINSKTPGHPEPHLLPGIEISSGPLGQGIAAAVGMAIAERKHATMFNVFGNLIDHYTYCFHGDGCLEEGVAYEAINLAGNLRLNKLILLYDSNKIQLDGKVSDSTNMKVKSFFESCGWNHIYVRKGNDVGKINAAIAKAKRSSKPTVIEINTIIGFGSPKAGSNTCHGSPFSLQEVEKMKNKWGYKNRPFEIPTIVEEDFTEIILKRGNKLLNNFYKELRVVEFKDTKLYNQYLKTISNEVDVNLDWFKNIKFKESNSTREIVGELVNVLVKNIPTLMVGSADVSSSTKIGANAMVPFNSSNYSGQRINYGVREFAMASIVNGMTAHGGIKAIGSTFLSFFDYNKAAIRLAAIGQIPSINVYSHDSITVGEDGPTHQPVEQIASLRLIPNHYLFRPCNLYESLYALKFALDSKTAPVTIVTSRSAFKQYQTKSYEDVSKGAYVISNTPNKSYRLTLIATGSEVETAIRVQELLTRKRISARVVSAPCLELFDKQNRNYISETLGNKPIISIEYGVTTSWYKYVDLAIGIDDFGRSGNAKDIIKYYKLTPEDIATKICRALDVKKTVKKVKKSKKEK